MEKKNEQESEIKEQEILFPNWRKMVGWWGIHAEPFWEHVEMTMCPVSVSDACTWDALPPCGESWCLYILLWKQCLFIRIHNIWTLLVVWWMGGGPHIPPSLLFKITPDHTDYAGYRNYFFEFCFLAASFFFFLALLQKQCIFIKKNTSSARE